MAVACSETAVVPAGSFRADGLAALVPAGAWERLSCADGSKGPRLHDWALIETADAGRWLLARRPLRPGEKGQLELAFFRCWSPGPVMLAELIAVAGARWGIEDCFAEAKNETGLDHYQVRKYQAWYRHLTLSMLAHAFSPSPRTPPGPGPRPAGTTAASRVKKGTRGLWTELRPRRTYSPPLVITADNGDWLIQLTAARAAPCSASTRGPPAPRHSTSTGRVRFHRALHGLARAIAKSPGTYYLADVPGA